MNERGSVTLWLLGLSMCLMTLGAVSVDLWNLMAHRRELAAIADASARAAAGAVDEGAWRIEGDLRIDAPEARRRALAVVLSHSEVAGSVDLDPGWIRIDPGSGSIRVSLTEQVPTALLGLAGRGVVTIGAASEAVAVVSP